MEERYRIRIMGRLGPALAASFFGMRCELTPGRTVIRGRMSREELQRLLERMDRYGVTVTELNSTP